MYREFENVNIELIDKISFKIHIVHSLISASAISTSNPNSVSVSSVVISPCEDDPD